MNGYAVLVGAHVVVGCIALATFWIAGLTRKGSPLHRRAGKIYLLAMIGILATSLPMSLVFLARGRVAIGVFLAYLVLITATSCWLSWRAIQLKRERAAYFNTRYRAVAWANLGAGLGVFAIGVGIGDALLYLFCWVGVFIGVSMLQRQREQSHAPNWWLREHYGAMIGNGVATHVAFLGIGLRGVISAIGWPWLSLVPWLAPLAFAIAATVYFNRRYAPRPAVGHG